VSLCQKQIPSIGEEGGLLSSWLCFSYNQFNVEQERILILTKKAYYRIKFDFMTKTMVRSDRVELSTIVKIQVRPYSRIGEDTGGGLFTPCLLPLTFWG